MHPRFPRETFAQESGLILVTVLMVTSLMMILIIGIISTNVSGVLTGQKQVDRIKAEQLALAAYLLTMDRLNQGLAPTNISKDLDGKYFTANVAAGTVELPAPYDATTAPYDVTVNY